MMRMRFFFLIALGVAVLGFNSKSLAQAKYFPGYVILVNGDSLKGELKKNPKREFDNFVKASFRKKEGSEIKAYTALKLKEYSVDGKIYVSRNIDGEQVFIKLISRGAMNLYESQVEVLQMNDVKIKSDYFMEKAGEAGPIKIKSGKFKKQVQDAMGDNESIVKGLEDKTYEYENIVEVFNAYNKVSKN